MKNFIRRKHLGIAVEIGMRVMDTYDDENVSGICLAFDDDNCVFRDDDGDLHWCEWPQIAIAVDRQPLAMPTMTTTGEIIGAGVLAGHWVIRHDDKTGKLKCPHCTRQFKTLDGALEKHLDKSHGIKTTKLLTMEAFQMFKRLWLEQ